MSVKEITVKAQTIHTRMSALVKALALVSTTGTGTGLAVQKFVSAHWEMLAPLAQVADGAVLAATAALVALLASAWLCLVAGCFLAVMEAVQPPVKKPARGKARAAQRSRQVRANNRGTGR